MRMLILAAALAALTSWPTDVRAQDMDPEVEKIAQCAGATLAHSMIRAILASDPTLMKRGYLIASRAMYSRHKKARGHFPDPDALAAQWSILSVELDSFIQRYDKSQGGWSRPSFREIAGCYADIGSFLFVGGGGALSENEIETMRLLSHAQSDNVIQSLK